MKDWAQGRCVILVGEIDIVVNVRVFIDIVVNSIVIFVDFDFILDSAAEWFIFYTYMYTT